MTEEYEILFLSHIIDSPLPSVLIPSHETALQYNVTRYLVSIGVLLGQLHIPLSAPQPLALVLLLSLPYLLKTDISVQGYSYASPHNEVSPASEINRSNHDSIQLPELSDNKHSHSGKR